MTARVKISQNINIHAKVYLVHLKVVTLSNLMCSTYVCKYIYRSKYIDHLSLVKASLSCIVEDGQNDSQIPCVHSWFSSLIIATENSKKYTFLVQHW